MSLAQIAFVAKSAVPDRAQLETAVRKLGFEFSIDQIYRPFQCSGFLPCELKGKKSGFEIYFEPSNNYCVNLPHLKKTIGDRDSAIIFRWGGDMAECVCVLIVSATLAKNFGAVVYYENDDLLYSTDQLFDEANAALSCLK